MDSLRNLDVNMQDYWCAISELLVFMRAWPKILQMPEIIMDSKDKDPIYAFVQT